MLLDVNVLFGDVPWESGFSRETEPIERERKCVCVCVCVHARVCRCTYLSRESYIKELFYVIVEPDTSKICRVGGPVMAQWKGN